MKILLEIGQIAIAGAERVVVDLACYYKEQGHEVYLVVLSPKKNNSFTKILDDKGIQCYYFEEHRRNTYVRIKRYIFLRDTIEKIQPDVIHGHLDYKYLWIYAIVHKKRIVETFHSEAYRLDGFIFRMLYNLLRRKRLISSVCLTPSGAENFGKLFGDAASIEVVPNPIDLKRFHPGDKKEESKILKFGFIARFHPVKRHDILLKAFKKFCLKHNEGLLLLAGEGETRADEIKRAQELQIEDRVIFLGNVEDVPALMQEIDVGVISSETESFSLFLVECMAAGLPVIITGVGGMLDVIGDNGIIVEAGNVDELAEAMEKMSCSEELREEMGEKSLQKAKRYSLDKVGNEYLDLYAELIGNE